MKTSQALSIMNVNIIKFTNLEMNSFSLRIWSHWGSHLLSHLTHQSLFYWPLKWQPTPVFLLGEFYGQKGLAGHSPWGCKELDTTERPPLTHLRKGAQGCGLGHFLLELEQSCSLCETCREVPLGPCRLPQLLGVTSSLLCMVSWSSGHWSSYNKLPQMG